MKLTTLLLAWACCAFAPLALAQTTPAKPAAKPAKPAVAPATTAGEGKTLSLGGS